MVIDMLVDHLIGDLVFVANNNNNNNNNTGLYTCTYTQSTQNPTNAVLVCAPGQYSQGPASSDLGGLRKKKDPHGPPRQLPSNVPLTWP